MPTPGATSATLADKELNSYIDNGDGTYTVRTGSGGGGASQNVAVTNTPLPVTSTTANPVIAVLGNNAVGAQWNSHNNSGSATAPAANANISGNATASTGAGYYRIEGYYGLGNTSETTPNNFQLAVNGTKIDNVLPAPSGVAGFWSFQWMRVLANNDTVSIVAPAAGASGTQYFAGVILTRQA